MVVGYILSIIIGYLLGSIPFGLVLTKMAGLGDIRQIGSGNIGATNVLRTGRKDLALLTLLCDIGKAAFAAYLCQWIFHSQIIGVVAGVFAVFGHNYPVWLKFKGGKGVASTLGLMFGVTPVVGVCTSLTWLLMAVLFRYSSLSALTALTLAPIYAFFLEADKRIGCVYFLLTILSFYRHRSNIVRLIHKEETKIKFKKKSIEEK
ncbi:MAG: glycerol-3-phosphate 1-O-acyltransferase PlsY [Alphaproteobacteria bacterium]|nr:glycerol-3-phosphate 1-O-acyltransferase PlsY [Alphaproteobacteria bacterium]